MLSWTGCTCRKLKDLEMWNILSYIVCKECNTGYIGSVKIRIGRVMLMGLSNLTCCEITRSCQSQCNSFLKYILVLGTKLNVISLIKHQAISINRKNDLVTSSRYGVPEMFFKPLQEVIDGSVYTTTVTKTVRRDWDILYTWFLTWHVTWMKR